jgi:hypothetical protein
MRALLFTAFLLLGVPALADQKKKAAPPPAPSDDKSVQTDASGKKSKSYTFTGLDLDGKLKTPQLLYFLNRMKSEFDTTTPSRRSFLPELKRSTDEM